MATKKKKKSPTCTVEFSAWPSAVLFDKRGRSINVINFPKGHRLTAKDRARATKRLMAGCGELSRRRSR